MHLQACNNLTSLHYLYIQSHSDSGDKDKPVKLLRVTMKVFMLMFIEVSLCWNNNNECHAIGEMN